MDVTVRFAGEAGQGIETAGELLASAIASTGRYVFTTQSYMSRIRGGLNWFDIRIGDRPLYSGVEQPDILVALTAEALHGLSGTTTLGGMTFCDDESCEGAIGIPFTATAKEIAGTRVMANTVAVGTVFSILGLELDELLLHLKSSLSNKGNEIIEANVRCAERGAELGTAHRGVVQSPPPADAPHAIYNAAEAIGLGAALSGVKFVAAYPMTPSTPVFTYLAAIADEHGIIVEQAEDEIAAVNMICGAAYTGVPAFATTSGGGFALMVEGVSLAAMLELPIVIMVAQRPGPATGLPTRTAQQDLRFVLHAGHGEFPRAIFAPGTPGQSFTAIRRALETAHRFQTPAFLLADQFMIDSRRNCEGIDRSYRPIDRHVLLDPSSDYVRYVVTDNGVSPRALPGGPAFVVVDSDEHTEDGHITEDLSARVRLQDKRMRKEAGMTTTTTAPEFYGEDAPQHLMVCWGSTYGPCREAVDLCNANGRRTAMLHFSQVWPLDPEVIHDVVSSHGASLTVGATFVEGNQTGQFVSILRERGIVEDHDLITRYDGMPFTAEEIARRFSG